MWQEKKIRRIRRKAAVIGADVFLAAKVRFRRLQIRILNLRHQRGSAFVTALALLIGVVTAFFVAAHWRSLADHLDSIDHAVFPALAVAIAAAMLGVIGIVFSLSIFSIQQVADRGTSLTLREYAEDWVLRTVFWIFAAFACIATGISLVSTKKPYATAGVVVDSVILVLTCALLKVYFNRAILFADVHYTIKKMESRGQKELSRVAAFEAAMLNEYRMDQRARRRSAKK